MRRPLFGNGIPVPVALAPVQVFDTKAIDPPNEQHSYALTLYFWDTPADAAVGFTAFVVTAGSPVTYINLSAANLATKKLTPNGAALVIDKLVLRGDQQVFVNILTGGAGHVYGYFERDGVQDLALNYRPFQPSNNLVPPYNANPAALLLGPSATGSVDIHALDPDYIDIIQMMIASATDQAMPAGPPFARIDLPGGGVSLPYLTKGSNQYLNDVVFPGIPMRAPSSAAADKLIKLFLSSDTTVASLTGATAFGFFNRG
jgi:hypothetical protein